MNYFLIQPDATIRYHASRMVLNIDSDASYLSGTLAKSRASGYYFWGEVPKSIVFNGNIFVMCRIITCAVASASEAELGALFMNIKDVKSSD